MRIASLLPSATDITTALGGGAELVGVSHSCGPAWQHLPALTSTWLDKHAASAVIDAAVVSAQRPLYELDIERLEALRPDVVISQSLCDVCAVPSGDVVEAISQLSSRPVLVDLAPSRLQEVPGCFLQVGNEIGRPAEAQTLVTDWHNLFARYRNRYQAENPQLIFLDWLDPPFVAGHWVPGLIQWLGGTCLLAKAGEPSFKASWAEIEQHNPDLVIAACCGFTASRAQSEALGRPVVVLDGYELFSRPGPSLMQSLVVLDQCIAEYLSNNA